MGKAGYGQQAELKHALTTGQMPLTCIVGEKVQGHTKNAPQDGKALPRHPGQYVTLPFEILDGDLMIGLFGELHYE